MLIIKSDYGDIYTDSNFIKNITIEKYKANINLPEFIINAVVTNEDLMENINYLNTQLNQKSYQINNLQNVLAQNKASVGEYRVKIDELTRSLNKKEEKVADPELIRLKEIVTKKEEEKSNEINSLKGNIEDLNEIRDDKNNEINSLKQEVAFLEDKSNNDSFIKKLFKTGE